MRALRAKILRAAKIFQDLFARGLAPGATGAADDAAAQVGLDGEAEAVEPLGVGGVAAEPGGQVVAGAGPLVRAADPGGVLDRRRGRVGLLAVIRGEPGRERDPELLEGAPQPTGAA